MQTAEIKNKILEGARLAIKKLVDKKRRENSYLVVSEQGKVIRKKASEINL